MVWVEGESIFLNRVYFVTVAEGCLCGAVVGRLPPGGERAFNDGYFYPEFRVNPERLAKARAAGFDSTAFLELDEANFRFDRSQVSGLRFRTNGVWQWRGRPCAGFFTLELPRQGKRSFVLIGYQDADGVLKQLADAGIPVQVLQPE